MGGVMVHGINSGGSNQPIHNRPLGASGPGSIDNDPAFENDCNAVALAMRAYNHDAAILGQSTELSGYALTQAIQALASYLGFRAGYTPPVPDASNPQAQAVWKQLTSYPPLSTPGSSMTLADLCYQTGSNLYSVTIDGCFNYNAFTLKQNLFAEGGPMYSAFMAPNSPQKDSGTNGFKEDIYALYSALGTYQQLLEHGGSPNNLEQAAAYVSQCLNQLQYDLANGVGGKPAASDGLLTILENFANEPMSNGGTSLQGLGSYYLSHGGTDNLLKFEEALNANGADLMSVLKDAYTFEGWGNLPS
jgi:hypothetical protein